MTIVQRYVTKSPIFAKIDKMKKVEGLTLHSVGCAQPKAMVFINLWDVPTFNSYSVTAIIDANDGTVYQCRDWDARSAHVGGSANNTHIGVETCEPPNIKYVGGATLTCSDPAKALEYVKRTYDSAVELFAWLCDKYDLNPTKDGVIISHKEAHDRGMGSNHGDIDHLWRQLNAPYTMDGFRADVKAKLAEIRKPVEPKPGSAILYRVRKSWEDAKSQKGAFSVLENAIFSAESWGTGDDGYKVFDPDGNQVYPVLKPETFVVRVEVDSLRIRTGPGIDNPITGEYTGKGAFTIVDVKSGPGSDSGWGLLKAYEKGRNGWISLDYVTKM